MLVFNETIKSLSARQARIRLRLFKPESAHVESICTVGLCCIISSQPVGCYSILALKCELVGLAVYIFAHCFLYEGYVKLLAYFSTVAGLFVSSFQALWYIVDSLGNDFLIPFIMDELHSL
jgi:hypothetical protein